MPDVSHFYPRSEVRRVLNKTWDTLDDIVQEYTQNQNSSALDAVTKIEFDYSNPGAPKILVFESPRTNFKLQDVITDGPQTIRPYVGGPVRMKIDLEPGVFIQPLTWVMESEPPASSANGLYRGGEPCFNLNGNAPDEVSQVYPFGTIGFTASEFSYTYTPEADGAEEVSTIGTLPASEDPTGTVITNAVIGNNHVLARTDRAALDEVLHGSRYYDDFALLKTKFPLLDENFHLDLAVGQLNEAPAATGQIRVPYTVSSTGYIRLEIDEGENAFVFDEPEGGMEVMKSGATSGFTRGEIANSVVDINVWRRRFNDVCKVNNGFGTYGDSGSLVFKEQGGNYEGLGILSWADQHNSVAPHLSQHCSYFWSFYPPSTNGTAEILARP